MHVVNVSDVIERQKVSGFIVWFVVLSALIMFFDGYDVGAMAYAAPSIIRDWQVERAAVAIVFSSAFVGMAIGSVAFGLIGDRFGRKPTLIAVLVIFGVFTLCCLLATNLTHLAIFRFFAGLGLGGLLPVNFALAIEYVPKRFRASVVTIGVVGWNLGLMSGGLVSAWLVPVYGWHLIFWIGGIGPLLVALVALFTLPESLKYLVLSGKKRDGLIKTLRRLDPAATISSDTRFKLDDADEADVTPGDRPSAWSIAPLFVGRLRFITPLLWVSYLTVTLTTYFITSWTPTLANSLGVTAKTAALGTSLVSVGVIVASLLMMRFLDRYGAIVITIMPLLAIPLLLWVGAGGLSENEFLVAMFAMGMLTGGAFNGVHSVAGLYYPSEIRAKAIGCAIFSSRLGSIFGPALGGYLLGMQLLLSDLYAVMTVPLLIFAVSIFSLGILHRAMLRQQAGPMATASSMR
ncbi:MAG: MFS transporter [Xanthobacteraceae bacterium]